jgi:hypothetical protein
MPASGLSGVGRPHDASGFAGRPQAVLDHRGFAGAARLRQIGGEFLAVEFDDLADLGVGAGVDAEPGTTFIRLMILFQPASSNELQDSQSWQPALIGDLFLMLASAAVSSGSATTLIPAAADGNAPRRR